MSHAPDQCPTCTTAIPAGALRCPGCGRVFGDDNRCPQCSATAAVRRKGDIFVCAACGAPREVKPETVVLGKERAVRPSTALAARSRGYRVLGVLGIATGLVAAVGGALVGLGALGIGAGAVLGGALMGAGFFALRRASRGNEAASQARQRAYESRVLALAAEHQGELLATQVAAKLGVSVDEADAILTGMADGQRVTLEVDPEGVLHYVFREVRASLSPKVRVGELNEEEQIAKEAKAQVERELRERGRRL